MIMILSVKITRDWMNSVLVYMLSPFIFKTNEVRGGTEMLYIFNRTIYLACLNSHVLTLVATEYVLLLTNKPS